MNKWWIILSIGFFSQNLQAQALEEFTQQKKTQVKYLLEQIAALKTYAGSIEKGYDIAQKGLHIIHSIKEGDFNLHLDYFTSLVKVNPKIKTYAKVGDIIGTQASMIKLYQSSLSKMKQSGWFSADEMEYATNVFSNLISASIDLLDQLIMITSGDGVKMTDNERLNRIDKLYVTSKDQYSFEQHFTNSIQLLGLQRAKEAGDLHVLQSYYGIH